MDRNTQRNGLINLLAMLFIGLAAYAVGHYGKTMAGVTAVVFMALGFLVALVSWFQMRLEERERLEKLEYDELARSAGKSALFNEAEAEVFPVRRSREQFERYFVPIFTGLLCVVEIVLAILLWRSLRSVNAPELNTGAALTCGGMFAMFFLLLFILGRFATSFARLENSRLLRPGAAYLLLNAYLCLLVAGDIWAVESGFKTVDQLLTGAFTLLLLLIGIETLANLLLEMYRPRVKGKVPRPIYESRLVSLLGQPEGLVTTAAQTLDYQFGFNVSETWAYRLLERWLPWMLLGQVVVLLLSTTVVFVDPGEQAVLEHFGKFERILGPGGHLKLPWPADKVYRFATDRIQTIDVGFKPEESEALAGNTVLWTVPHMQEENFLIADRELNLVQSETNVVSTNTASTTNHAPPVALLTVSIPVQFQVTNLQYWFYTNEEPETLLGHIAYREVARYFVSVDPQEIMSVGRADASRVLRARIQAEADRHQLGASIVFVGLQDIHPPVKVAPDYEKVVAALQTTNADYLDAIAYQITTNAAADAEAFRIVSEARAEKARREKDAEARASLFTNQVPAFMASPQVYTHRAYLETLGRNATNSRMYVLLATNTSDVIIMNLEDKIRADVLQNLVLPTVAPRTNTAAGK